MAVKTASVLAFERKLNNSDALLYSGVWEERDAHPEWSGVAVREKAVRGTISNRLKNAITSDPAKLDTEVQKPNLQTVDSAALPFEHDTLKVAYTLRVLGGFERPSACNDADYESALSSAIESYRDERKCAVQAKRYACNIVNGRALWRNRVGAEAVEIRVRLNDGDELVFDGYARALDDFDSSDERLDEIAEFIRSGLMGEGYRLLDVVMFVKLGKGQEVFPSQELIQDKQDDKSKHLYQVQGVAGMHSQKIGNALRTIDTWHPSIAEIGPIAVESYGAVTSRGSAYRSSKEKADFYTLLDNWVTKGKAPEIDQQHYVVAMLIRGGVFGEKA